MTTIVTRASQTTSLSWTQMDANFTNLNTYKVEQYTPQSYCSYGYVGITSPITWSNTLIKVQGFATGPAGETSLVNYGTSATLLMHGTYIGSDYGKKYTTTGTTPVYLSLSGGQFSVGVSASSGTAGAAATFSIPLVVDGATGGVQVNSVPISGYVGMRNRIINGDMRIDQRNVGTAVTINSAAYTYGVDRWAAYGQSADGVFTMQQLTTSPPAGFTHYLRLKTSTADASIGAGQIYLLRHQIEGNYAADLDFGLSTAKTVTISFWARSSLTGTFGGVLGNQAGDRNYPFTYAISVANVWEYKTITIAGDTTGTWNTDSQGGPRILFDLGCGSTYKGTALAWTSSGVFGVTGTTDLIATLNASLDITGVQFEVGTVATSFERRPFKVELDLCKRYYQKTFAYATAPAQNAGADDGNLVLPINPTAGTASVLWTEWRYEVELRATPTVTTTYNPGAANANWRSSAGGADFTVVDGGSSSKRWIIRASNVSTGTGAYIHATVHADY